jgi:hypothetical protein
MAAFVSLNDQSVLEAFLSVPGVGPWFADLALADDAPALAAGGPATLQIGASSWKGTIVPSHAGTFGLQRRLRVVAGGGGWGRMLPAKQYHSDAGVKARQVATDAAREAGETLGDFATGGADRLGADYVRPAGPASSALEDAAQEADWWVGADGITRVGVRPTLSPPATAYDVQRFDPEHRLVELAVDDLASVGVGAVLAANLDEPVTIRALEVTIRADKIRARAWVGAGRRSILADRMRAIVARCVDAQLLGAYRYRVVQHDGERVNLQVVRKRAGVPDLLHVDMWPVSGNPFTGLITPNAPAIGIVTEGNPKVTA